MFLNIEEVFTKRFVKDYFLRNKILIVISILILVLSSVIGVLISDSIREVMLNLIRNVVSNFPKDGTVFEKTLYLFMNNLRVDLIVLLGGLTFSLLSFLVTFTNGVVLGYTFTIVSPIVFIVGIFPHGIFELTASVLSLVGAFLITKLEIRLIIGLINRNFKEKLGESKVLLQDILFSIIITVVLLVIAAFVESGITPILLSMVT